MADTPESEEQLEKIKQVLRQKARLFRSVFSTPEGEKVLEALREELDGPEVMDDNPYRTHYNLGRRDAVVYIDQLLRHANREDDLDE